MEKERERAGWLEGRLVERWGWGLGGNLEQRANGRLLFFFLLDEFGFTGRNFSKRQQKRRLEGPFCSGPAYSWDITYMK